MTVRPTGSSSSGSAVTPESTASSEEARAGSAAPMYDVVVVGGGPAGLAAATALRQGGAGRVAVLEREREAGGIPRHTDHTGFGLHDLRRLKSGPRYADALVAQARQWGVDLLCSTTVTGWATDVIAASEVSDAGETSDARETSGASDAFNGTATGDRRLGVHRLTVCTADGPSEITATAVVLATGCRERPRAARLVAGDRPARGVLTTGALQQLAIRGSASTQVGRRAVVVGAEHVSFSAVLTLAHAGCRTVAMVTEHRRHQTHGAFRLAAALRWRTPVRTSSRVISINGRHGVVTSVEIEDVRTGRRTVVECDTVVFTGGWIPDHELARLAGLVIDPASGGPIVDQGGHTSRPGVFAVGNLVHPAETAGACSLAGRSIAPVVVAFLHGGSWPAHAIRITCAPPLEWIAPGSVTPGLGPPPRGRFVARVSEPVRNARLMIEQEGRRLDHQSLGRLAPNQTIEIEPGWIAAVAVAPDAGPIEIRLR